MCHWIYLSFAVKWWISAGLLLCPGSAFTLLLANTSAKGNLSQLMLRGMEVLTATCWGYSCSCHFKGCQVWILGFGSLLWLIWRNFGDSDSWYLSTSYFFSSVVQSVELLLWKLGRKTGLINWFVKWTGPILKAFSEKKNRNASDLVLSEHGHMWVNMLCYLPHTLIAYSCSLIVARVCHDIAGCCGAGDKVLGRGWWRSCGFFTSCLQLM